MAVSPTSLAYGSTNNTLVFTFSPTVGDFGAGSAVDLIIPAGWTTPTTAAGAGHVTVSSGTCTLSGAPPFGIAGSTISIDMASCTVGQSFTVTYSGVTAPAISGSPYEFITQTDIGPGGEGLTTIASSPKVTISKAPLTVSASGLTPNNKTYDGTTAATLVLGSPSLVGVIGTDDVSLVTASASGAFTNENVGTAKTVNISGLTLGGLDAGNYTLSQPTRTANISARSITVTAVTDTKTYDGTTSSSGTPTLSVGTPLAAGDSEPVWTQTFDTENFGSGKTLTPAGTVSDGNSGLNYSYNFVTNTSGVINKKAITVTAVTDTKTYDGTTSSSGTPTLSVGTPLAAGDSEPVWTQTFDTENFGSGKTLTPAGTVSDGNSGLNYSYNFVTNTSGVINKKAITITAVTDTKTYDGTTSSSGTPTLSVGTPLAAGDSEPVWTQTFDTENFGSGKTLTPAGTVSDGNSGLNYSYNFVTNTSGVINKKAITVTAVTDTKTYDGTTSSSGTPTLSVGTPLAAGDSEPVWTQTFDTENFGSGKTLTPAGTVSDGNSGLNYSYNFVTNTSGVINKKAITVTAVTDTKTYDGTTSSSGTPTLSVGTPLAAGDSEPVWTQTFDTENFGSGKTLTPAGTVSDGNSGLNYSYNFVTNTSGVINKKAITVTAVTDTKAYDGTTSSSGTPTLSVGTPLAAGDSAAWNQSFDTKNVGASKTLTPYGVVDDGNSGLNYDYTFTPDVTGEITVANISVTANPQTKTYGAADPTLTYDVTPPLFSGDAFTGQLERAAGEDVNSYVISQGNLLAANYSISFTGSNLTIDQATLNAKANDKTIIFGNPDPTFDITYTGFQFSENAAVLNSVPTCGVTGDHTAVGTYTISCSGGSDNNYAFTYSDGVLTVNPVPVAIFADVPLSYWANNHIERLYSAGITGGCSTVPLNYCPTKPVTRAQMAIFLVRAMHGVGFTPPSATGVFADVPVGSFGADFIEQLATDGITSGCGGGNFCPNSIVTRSQMAIFLVRAKHGIAFVPPTATGVFPDVPVGSFGADFIEQLVTDGVTSGCGGGLYCPSAMVKRDSMAVFLVKNFNLP